MNFVVKLLSIVITIGGKQVSNRLIYKAWTLVTGERPPTAKEVNKAKKERKKQAGQLDARSEAVNAKTIDEETPALLIIAWAFVSSVGVTVVKLVANRVVPHLLNRRPRADRG